MKGAELTRQRKDGMIGDVNNLVFKLSGRLERVMSYLENFKSQSLMVNYYGDLHFYPLKPKTKVAIVTCMDSRLYTLRQLWG